MPLQTTTPPAPLGFTFDPSNPDYIRAVYMQRHTTPGERDAMSAGIKNGHIRLSGELLTDQHAAMIYAGRLLRGQEVA